MKALIHVLDLTIGWMILMDAIWPMLAYLHPMPAAVWAKYTVGLANTDQSNLPD